MQIYTVYFVQISLNTKRKSHTVFDRNKFWILGCFEFVNYLSNLHCITCKNQDKYMRKVFQTVLVIIRTL